MRHIVITTPQKVHDLYLAWKRAKTKKVSARRFEELWEEFYLQVW